MAYRLSIVAALVIALWRAVAGRPFRIHVNGEPMHCRTGRWSESLPLLNAIERGVASGTDATIMFDAGTYRVGGPISLPQGQGQAVTTRGAR